MRVLKNIVASLLKNFGRSAVTVTVTSIKARFERPHHFLSVPADMFSSSAISRTRRVPRCLTLLSACSRNSSECWFRLMSCAPSEIGEATSSLTQGGSRSCALFFVDGGAAMRVASTIVPTLTQQQAAFAQVRVDTLEQLRCQRVRFEQTAKHSTMWSRRAPSRATGRCPQSCASPGCRGSHLPLPSSARSNHCCRKYMRNMRGTPMG